MLGLLVNSRLTVHYIVLVAYLCFILSVFLSSFSAFSRIKTSIICPIAVAYSMCVCLKNVHPFIFVITQSNVDWVLQYLVTAYSWGNLQPNDVYISYNIQFVYKYYRVEKQERFCMLSMQEQRKHKTWKKTNIC